MSNTQDVVKKMFDFCNMDFTLQTRTYINKEHNNSSDAYSVFRTNHSNEKWKSLPLNIINEIDDDLKRSDLNIFNN